MATQRELEAARSGLAASEEEVHRLRRLCRDALKALEQGDSETAKNILNGVYGAT